MELLIGLYLLIIFAALLFSKLTILGAVALVVGGFTGLVLYCFWYIQQD